MCTIKNHSPQYFSYIGSLWLFFLSVSVTSYCDVGNNDDGICTITSPVFVRVPHLYLYKYLTCICTSTSPVFVRVPHLYLYEYLTCICMSISPVFVRVPHLYLYEYLTCICTSTSPVFVWVPHLYVAFSLINKH
jgi:hypothetical protein